MKMSSVAECMQEWSKFVHGEELSEFLTSVRSIQEDTLSKFLDTISVRF